MPVVSLGWNHIYAPNELDSMSVGKHSHLLPITVAAACVSYFM